jgi:7-cyano-7-deazaguanine synthase
MSYKTVLIYSGGLDSTVLLYKLIKSDNREVRCINFWYGSKHNIRERRAAQMICKNLNIPLEYIPLDFIGKFFKSSLLENSDESIPKGGYKEKSMKSTVVPFRNGIMLSIAAGFAESIGYDIVALANHAGDHHIYPDCRPEFIAGMNFAIQEGTYHKISIISPFCSYTKGDIVCLGLRLNVPFELTWTCYEGKDLHCGFCGACNERKEAFKEAKILDPTIYMDSEKQDINDPDTHEILC